MADVSDDSVYIVAAARTPIGSFMGALSSLKSHQMGSIVIREVLKRAAVEPADVDDVIFGQVNGAGQGQNPARQAAISAGIPVDVPASIVNMICGSGLKAVWCGVQAIRCGDARVVVAGGHESMSQMPHVVLARAGCTGKLGDVTLRDSLLCDGLLDAFTGIHMGVTAENIARRCNISREEQDEFACRSQNLFEAAVKSGAFVDEIVGVPVTTAKGDCSIVLADEFPRPGTTMEKLAALRPVFEKDGSVTAGNSSGLNDGAAAVLLMSGAEVRRRQVAPLARVVSAASCGVEPQVMGLGPLPATVRALDKAGWSIDDVDLFELNEAFAAQAVAVQRELRVPLDRVNVLGGSIAVGHPLGASGARVLVTLVYALKSRRLKRGVAALCVGGGMGVAMCIEIDN